jgi:hypothetical protein
MILGAVGPQRIQQAEPASKLWDETAQASFLGTQVVFMQQWRLALN